MAAWRRFSRLWRVTAAVAPRMTSSFALCFEGRLSDELTTHGHRPHMLGAVRLSRPHTVWRARRSLARLLARQTFDVVVCHQAWPYAIFGPTVRRARLPLVFWLHTGGDGRHWLERWARRLIPDLAVSNSRFTAERLARWFPGAPGEIVYYPLRLTATVRARPPGREDIRRSLDTSHEDLVIVQVGRLEPWKGNREALEALADLARFGRLEILDHRRAATRVGPAVPPRAEGGCTAAGLSDRVRFAGERSDVSAILLAADIYCQPNVGPEPFGLSFVEAQAAGLPIVTSALGGALEIVDETCGLLVAPRDIGALAAALRRLLGDAGLRARLGQGARQRSGALCNLTRQMQRTHDVLSSAVKRGRPSVSASPSVLESSARS